MTISQNMGPRVKLETVGWFIKELLMYLMRLQNYHLLAYAVTQLVYDTILLVGYPYFIGKDQATPKMEEAHLPRLKDFRVVDSVPERKGDSGKNYFTPYVLDSHTELLFDFTKQSVLKFVLEQGEKIFMIVFAA